MYLPTAGPTGAGRLVGDEPIRPAGRASGSGGASVTAFGPWVKALRHGQVAADPLLVPQLLCVNCGDVVVFGPYGWDHREPEQYHCPCLRIAWPPPLSEDA